MAQTIPNWLMKGYTLLYRKFYQDEFSFQDAMKTLHENDKILVSMILSELRKSGWLEIRINPEDARKRFH